MTICLSNDTVSDRGSFPFEMEGHQWVQGYNVHKVESPESDDDVLVIDFDEMVINITNGSLLDRQELPEDIIEWIIDTVVKFEEDSIKNPDKYQ